MALTMTEHAKEKSSYVIPFTFLDESGNAVIPNAANWTLTDPSGTVQNLRNEVAIAPAAAVNILLQGNDLAILAGEVASGKRIVTVKWTYDSALGAGLPGNEEIIFYIDNLVKIS